MAVVVDAHSSGAFLAPAFLCHGIHAVHVDNRTERSAQHLVTFAPASFVADVPYDGDLGAVVDELSAHRVAFVVAGTDSGIELADQLSDALALPAANPAATSARRRDKAAMLGTLERAGVPCPAFATVRSSTAALRWAASAGRPVVVKPLRSSGSDGVGVCASPDAAHDHAQRLLGGRDHYGKPNDAVLVEEYLTGPEYMVNTVSADGRHRVLEVWRSVKRLAGGVAVYDHQDLVPLDDPHHAAVADYVAAVLSAVDVRWGPAHTEIIVTACGPLLVEVSARLAGSISPSATVLATGQNQIVSTVRALVDPAGFLRDTPARVPLRRRCRGVSLICDRAGVVTEDLDWDRFRSLASFHGLRARVRAGDRLSVTGGLLSRPGGVYLVHDDPEVLDADLARIRAWEAEDLYRPVAPAAEPAPSRVASSVP